MKPLPDCRLYAFVDTGYLRGRKPADLARQLVGGGADLIQWRAKDWPPDRIADTARELLPICRDHGVRLVINDHPAIAVEVGASLVHLGQEDFFGAGHSRVTEVLPPQATVGLGLSTHSPADARRARAAGARYLAVGPVFPTPTKPGRPAVTLDYVRWAAENLADTPWFAIGGIHLENLREILAAGARRVCVVSAILNAPDVTAACRAFRAALETEATP